MMQEEDLLHDCNISLQSIGSKSPKTLSPMSPRSLPSLEIPTMTTLVRSHVDVATPLRSGALAPLLTNSSSSDEYDPSSSKNGPHQADHTTTTATVSTTTFPSDTAVDALPSTAIQKTEILPMDTARFVHGMRAKAATSTKGNNGRASVMDTNAVNLVQRWATLTRTDSDDEGRAVDDRAVDEDTESEDDEDNEIVAKLNSTGFKLNDGWDDPPESKSGAASSSKLKSMKHVHGFIAMLASKDGAGGRAWGGPSSSSSLCSSIKGSDVETADGGNGSEPHNTGSDTHTHTSTHPHLQHDSASAKSTKAIHAIMLKPKEPNPLTFLVVDDEDASRHLTRNILEQQLGHKVN